MEMGLKNCALKYFYLDLLTFQPNVNPHKYTAETRNLPFYLGKSEQTY